MSKRRNSAMWEYIDRQGLKDPSDAEIKALKKAYRKGYMLEYKRKRRKDAPEYLVCLKRNGEQQQISEAAKGHRMTVGAFLRKAALSYLNRAYLVPDRLMVARLAQILSACLDEIQSIARKKQKYFWDKNDKLEAIEKRITKLEAELLRFFHNPQIKNDNENTHPQN